MAKKKEVKEDIVKRYDEFVEETIEDLTGYYVDCRSGLKIWLPEEKARKLLEENKIRKVE